MTTPSEQDIFDVIDTSWPPAKAARTGPWVIRQDASGSKRVMAASLVPGEEIAELSAAEQAMDALGQPRLFQIRGQDQVLDAHLTERGYATIDRCKIYAGKAEALAAELAPATAWAVWPPLQAQREIWEAGGIGTGRQAIMDRAPWPKSTFLGRTQDTPVGAAFVSAKGALAMVHAVEVLAPYRRQGVARMMMQSAANWCLAQGIEWLTLITTEDNGASNALYAQMGMTCVGRYHYRIQEA